ncbi:hypothetical protein FQR65_LT05993 [Abscondita terminalis]|nr:hypothetical protein FQR65_LT05993 [Abscondita terminalis]
MSIIEYGVSKNCLKNIIQKHLKSDIIVHSVDTSNALAAGENFLSELLRIVVKYSVNKCEDVHLQSFIAKIPVDSQYVLELEEQIGFFNCEMTFYNNIFPFLEKLEYEIKVCPTPFYLSIKPTKIIILEDLSVMNYQTGNCQEGLNLEHCLFVIEKLAYFHAASLKIYEMKPSIMEKFCKGSMCKNLAVEVLIRVTFQEMLKTCQKHSSLQKYFEKMPKDFPEKFYLSAKPDPKLNVLNHGDFWCNNIMFKYNQDGQLQNALFNVIQEEVGNDIVILTIDTSNLLQPGENFICDLFKIVITFCELNSKDVRSKSFILKRLLDDQVMKDYDQETDIINCELSVYDTILPLMEKEEYKKKIAPQSFYSSTEPQKLIVLEDLSVLNYKTKNRQTGLNLDHCLCAIEKLAYFHASSLSIYEQNPKILEKYNVGLLFNCKTLVALASVNCKEILKICQKEPSLQKYSNRINEELIEKPYMITKRNSNFNVLNHGDFWTNNLMFKSNENGRIEDVLFVDFQMVVFTSPVFDLHYFLASSPNLEVLKNHINTIIDHYYHSLCKYALVLNTKMRIPQRYEFDLDFRHKAFAGLIIAYTHMPIIKSDNRKDASFMNFVHHDGEGSFRHHCYNNNNFLTNFKCLLSIYEEMGLFKT